MRIAPKTRAFINLDRSPIVRPRQASGTIVAGVGEARASLRLGKYRLIIELAQGGMGCVYLAVAEGPAGFSKLTVIKELKKSLLDEPGFLEMFLDEAKLSARLSHPNVVQTNEV